MLAGPLRLLDPDETVTGLMAARIARGTGYTYFAGQAYMGALEQYLQAPFAALAPGNAFLLRLPQIVLGAVACWLTYRVGCRLLDGRRAAVAAWLFAAGPAFNLAYGVKSRGAYDAALVTGLVGLLVALRHEPRRGEVRTALAFGFCCGLGAWLSLLSAFLLLPALCRLAVARWQHRWRAAGAAVAGAGIGALPLLLWWLRHGLATGLTAPPMPTGRWQRFRGLLDPVLPEFLGLDWRVGVPAVAAALRIAALAALALLVVSAARRRLARSGRRPSDLLLLAVPIAALLYVASPYTWYTAEPRYLFSCYPLLALGIAAMLPERRSWAAPAAVTLTLALSVSTLHRFAPPDIRPDLTRLAAYLQRSGYPAVYADYQLAFPLDYYVPQRIVAVPWGGRIVHFPDLSRRVAAAPRFAYAVVDRDEAEMIRLLTTARVRYRRTSFGTLRAFTDLSPALRPGQLRAAP